MCRVGNLKARGQGKWYYLCLVEKASGGEPNKAPDQPIERSYHEI